MPVPTTITDLSTNPASNYPLGSEPVFPDLDNHLRAHAAFIAQLRDRLDAEGLPLASVMWWGGARAQISARMRPLDGQLLNRADYPALWAFVTGGGYPFVTDAVWTGTPTSRASFSSGNGSTTFRMPDLNGRQASGIGAVTLRGDGASSAGAPGQLQDSQNGFHNHAASTNQAGAHGHGVSGVTDAAGQHTHGVRRGDGNQYGAYSMRQAGLQDAGFDTTEAAGSHTHTFSASVTINGGHAHDVYVDFAGGDEARMKSATGAWVMRVI